MNDPSAAGCGSRRLAASTLGSRAPAASARPYSYPPSGRLVSPLHSAAAADLRNRCRDRCTGGVECGVAGHISPALEANAADIHTAYRWGPSQSHMATANPDAPLPIFLAFQPYVRSTPCPCACQDAPTALVRAGGVGGGAALAEGLHLGAGHGAGLAPDHRLPRVLRLYIRLKRRRRRRPEVLARAGR